MRDFEAENLCNAHAGAMRLANMGPFGAKDNRGATQESAAGAIGPMNRALMNGALRR